MKKIVLILITILGVQLFADRVSNQELIIVAQQWNQAKNSKNILALSQLYSPKVLYYRSMLNINSVLKDNVILFAKYPQFRQTIKNIYIQEVSSNIYNVSFDKYVQDKPSSEVKIYPGYLMLRADGGKVLVAEEGDRVTDKNIANHQTKKHKGQIVGDFDGDGVSESAWPVLKNCFENEDGYKMCDCYIGFSNNKSLYTGACLGEYNGMHLRNEGDLSGDGIDKIGLIHDWPTSNWNTYEVFSGSRKIFEMSVYSDGEINIYKADLVKKDPKRKGYVLYRYYNGSADGDISGSRWKSAKLK